MQDFSQLNSGCEKSRLNCLFRDIQDLANVAIAAVMEMSQHDDCPLIQSHRHQSGLDCAAQFDPLQQVVGQRAFINHPFVNLPRNAPAMARVDGLIQCDLVYPAEKLVLRIEIFEVTESLEEDILRNIACIFAIVEQSVSHVKDRLLVTIYQALKSIPASSK